MNIQFFAYLRGPEYAKCKGLSLEGPSTLKELGLELSERFGEKFHDHFFNEDETAIGPKTIVIVNGRKADFTGGLDTPLEADTTVLIFPIVAGG